MIAALIGRGFLTGTCEALPNQIRLLPPLVLTEAEARRPVVAPRPRACLASAPSRPACLPVRPLAGLGPAARRHAPAGARPLSDAPA